MSERRSPWTESATCCTGCACEAAGKAGQAEDPPHLPPAPPAAPPPESSSCGNSSESLQYPLSVYSPLSDPTLLLYAVVATRGWLCLDRTALQPPRSADSPPLLLLQVNTINTEEKGRNEDDWWRKNVNSLAFWLTHQRH